MFICKHNTSVPDICRMAELSVTNILWNRLIFYDLCFIMRNRDSTHKENVCQKKEWKENGSIREHRTKAGISFF